MKSIHSFTVFDCRRGVPMLRRDLDRVRPRHCEGKGGEYKSTSDNTVYSDASGLENHLGTAKVAFYGNQETIDPEQIPVGPMDRQSVHVTEPTIIFYAINTYSVHSSSPAQSDACGFLILASILRNRKSAP